MKIRTPLVSALFFTGCVLVQADIFVPATGNDGAVVKAVSDEKQGLYFQGPGLVWHEREQSVSPLGKLSAEGLTRDKELNDVSRSFRLCFDDAFRSEPSLDSYKAVRNNLLLLEYASPALADVLKHYRTLASERMILEFARLAEIEKAAQGPVDRLRRSAEWGCLKENQALGVVKAMEKCRMSGEPFDGLPLPDGGTLADGRLALHVVRDAVNKLGLSEKKSGDDAAVLAGEVVIRDNDVEMVMPAVTYDLLVVKYRSAHEKNWQDALDKVAAHEDLSGHALELLSLPGVPVTADIVKEVALQEKNIRGIMTLKLASVLAEFQAIRDHQVVRAYLEQAIRKPDLPGIFREMIVERKLYLENVTAGHDSARITEVYKTLLARILLDADQRRSNLLKGKFEM